MSFPLVPRGRYAFKAFTLIELLTVIAIIGILAGITLGVVRGVGDQARINRATAELATLASGLAAYKSFYGDYPWVGNDVNPDAFSPGAFTPSSNDRAYNLFRALGGRYSPKRIFANNNGIVQRQIDKDGTMVNKYSKSFVDFTLFSLERSNSGDAPGGGLFALPDPARSVTDPDPDFANAFIDPWRNRYLYYYKALPTGADWKSPNYVLFSAGPDGKVSYSTSDKTSGKLPDPTLEENADNVYATP
jgi:prepilin-type N-terminal cleavage/methylation domain-containing protein